MTPRAALLPPPDQAYILTTFLVVCGLMVWRSICLFQLALRQDRRWLRWLWECVLVFWLTYGVRMMLKWWG